MRSTFPRAAALFILSAVVPACDGGNSSSAPAGGGGASNVPPAVSILSPVAGESFPPHATIPITATASDPDGEVVQVDFFQEQALIGTAHSAPFAVSWSDVAAGDYLLTAIATDDRGAQSTSSPVSIRVGDGNDPPPDVFDGALGWTRYSGNPVLGPSTGEGAWDNGSVFPRTVLKLGPSSWVMYYSAVDRASTAIQVGRAVSRDGIQWTKDPAPVLAASGVEFSFDQFTVHSPWVDFDGSTYRMWYGGDGDIGLATSTDGVLWARHPGNPVFRRGPQGAWDAAHVGTPSVIRDNGVFKMWYGGAAFTYNFTIQEIGYATSPDGVTWSRYPGSIMTATAPIDSQNGVASPSVLKDGTLFRMWYSIPLRGGTRDLGYAWSSDGIAWTKFPDNAGAQSVFTVGAPGSWDDGDVGSPFVLKDGATFKLWYSGHREADATSQGAHTGYATNP